MAPPRTVFAVLIIVLYAVRRTGAAVAMPKTQRKLEVQTLLCVSYAAPLENRAACGNRRDILDI